VLAETIEESLNLDGILTGIEMRNKHEQNRNATPTVESWDTLFSVHAPILLSHSAA